VKSIDTILRKLTFDELHDWAGEKIRNRGKGYVKRVDQLSHTEDNTVPAKYLVHIDSVDFFATAIVRFRHQNYRPPDPVHSSDQYVESAAIMSSSSAQASF
jgi:hypothetical protein